MSIQGKTNYVTQQQLKTIRGGRGVGHIHSNKDTLDQITPEFFANMSETVSLAHSHNNRVAIDRFSYDPETNTIYVGDEDDPVNFAAFGDVAVGGLPGGSTPTGAQYLYQLTDVPDYRNDSTKVGKVLKVGSNNTIVWGDSASSFSQLSGSPYDNTSLATALNGKADSSAIADMATKTWVNGRGFLTEITSSMIITALGNTAVAKATDADTLDGQHASHFASASDLETVLALLSKIDSWIGYDEDNNAIYIKKDADNNARNFYTFGDVAVGGPGSGGGGGASFLYQLTDVPDYRNDSTKVGKVLKVGSDNTIVWGDGASSFGQLSGSPYDNTNLATALNGKADASSLGNYVAKAGDTMTGGLTIDHNATYPLTLKGATQFSVIHFLSRDGSQRADAGWLNDGRGDNAYIANISSSGVVAVCTNGVYYSNDTRNFRKYTIYHSGNLTASVITTALDNTAVAKATDADTLDGQHASYFAAASSLGNYLPLSGGTINGNLIISYNSTYPLEVKGGSNLSVIKLSSHTTSNDAEVGWLNGSQWNGNFAYILNKSSQGGIAVNNNGPYYFRTNFSNFAEYTIYHSGNANRTDTPWSCSNLTASGNATISGNAGIGTSPSYRLDVAGKTRICGADDGSGQLILMGTADTVRWWEIGRESLYYGNFQIRKYENGTWTIPFGLSRVNESAYINAPTGAAVHNNTYTLRVGGTCYVDSSLTSGGGIITTKLYINDSTVNTLHIERSAFTWAGSTSTYPLIWSSDNGNDKYTMICMPHIPFLRNGYRSYTGQSYGAVTRMESDAVSGNTYWDAGINSVDEYSISRAGVKRFVLFNSTTGLNWALGGGTYCLSSSVWLGAGSMGKDGYDKVVAGYLSSSTNGATIGAHNNTLTAWANLHIGALSYIYFDFEQSRRAALDSSGNFSLNGDVAVGSDARWKHQTTPVYNGLVAIMRLKPSEWLWNSDNRKGSGLIAQEVQPVLPHLVKTDNEGYLHLNYEGLHAYEISAIQHHEKEIERLRKKVAALEQEVKRLRS